MSALAVARKDFRAARRSRTLWAVGVLLGVVAALLGYAADGYRQSALETVRTMFSTLGSVLAFLLPIVALVATYLAIAGEREGGGIKFLLSLPNTRRDVFLGKTLSRAAIVAGGVAFVFWSASLAALARHGVFPAVVAVGMLAVTLAYGTAFVSVAVAMSAAAATRARAIAGAIAAYFALVVLYVVPVISVGSLVRWVHHTMLGLEPNPDLYDAVTYTSPYVAYRKATNLVLPDELDAVVFRRAPSEPTVGAGADAAPELPAYLADEVSLVVFAAWIVLPLAVGYWRFERADLE